MVPTVSPDALLRSYRPLPPQCLVQQDQRALSWDPHSPPLSSPTLLSIPMHQFLYPLPAVQLQPMRHIIRLPLLTTRSLAHSIAPRLPTQSPALVLLLDKPLPLLLSLHPISTATPSRIHMDSIRTGAAQEAAHTHSNNTSILPLRTSPHSIITIDPIDRTISHHEKCFYRSSSYSSTLYTPSHPAYTDHPSWPTSTIAEKSATRSSLR